MILQLPRYDKRTVPDGWCESRYTDLIIATAIHAVATPERSPEAIWKEPTEEERDEVRAAMKQYLVQGLFLRDPDGVYDWGCEYFCLDPER
jgi:hypothetical protein